MPFNELLHRLLHASLPISAHIALLRLLDLAAPVLLDAIVSHGVRCAVTDVTRCVRDVLHMSLRMRSDVSLYVLLDVSLDISSHMSIHILLDVSLGHVATHVAGRVVTHVVTDVGTSNSALNVILDYARHDRSARQPLQGQVYGPIFPRSR